MNGIVKFIQIERWVFWVAVALATLFFAVGAFFVYQYTDKKDVSLSITAPPHALIGAPFTVEARLLNNSTEAIEGAKLVLLLPEGAVAEGTSPDRRFVTKIIDSLAPQESFSARFGVTLYKMNDAVRRFTAVASYTVTGVAGGATVDIEKSAETSARDPAVTLDLEAPRQVLNGTSFTALLRYRNDANVAYDNARIIVSLPRNVTLESADPKPATSTTEWILPHLAPGSGGVITVKTRAIGEDASFFEIKSSVVDGAHPITEKIASITIAPSPLGISVAVDGTVNGAAWPNQTLRYTITYRNNTDVPMRDVVIAAKLTGDMFDLLKIRTRGSFSSSLKTITWNASSINDLELVRPGASGIAEFEATVKSEYSIKRLSDKNMMLAVAVLISSPTIPYYVTADQTTAVGGIETKIGGRTTIQASALFKNSIFENRGPLPLKSNTPTTLTVKWTIVNYATDVGNVEVKSSLPAGVIMTGKVKSAVQSVPLWNERTGEVSWTIGRITATKGVIGKPVEAEFQIEVTPSITQINQPMPILAETHLTAADEFTNTPIENTASALASDGIKDIVDQRISGVVVP